MCDGAQKEVKGWRTKHSFNLFQIPKPNQWAYSITKFNVVNAIIMSLHNFLQTIISNLHRWFIRIQAKKKTMSPIIRWYNMHTPEKAEIPRSPNIIKRITKCCTINEGGKKAGSGVVVPGVWRVRTKWIEKGTLIWTPARKNPGQMRRRHSRQRDCKFVLECWNSLYIFVWFFWSLLAMNLTTVEISFYDGGGRVSEVKRGLSRLKALYCQTKICHL